MSDVSLSEFSHPLVRLAIGLVTTAEKTATKWTSLIQGGFDMNPSVIQQAISWYDPLRCITVFNGLINIDLPRQVKHSHKDIAND